MAGKQDCKVFVGGLSWETTGDKLRSYFENYGAVREAFVSYNRNNGRPRGFGFVVFESTEVADKVVAAKHTIDRREVEAKKAVPKDENEPILPPVTGSVVKTRKIFVGGLAPGVDELVLREYFEQFGEVEDAVVMFDHENKRPRGFGFVQFATEESVDRVFGRGAMQTILDKPIEIKPAVPRDQMAAPPIPRMAPSPGGSNFSSTQQHQQRPSYHPQQQQQSRPSIQPPRMPQFGQAMPVGGQGYYQMGDAGAGSMQHQQHYQSAYQNSGWYDGSGMMSGDMQPQQPSARSSRGVPGYGNGMMDGMSQSRADRPHHNNNNTSDNTHRGSSYIDYTQQQPSARFPAGDSTSTMTSHSNSNAAGELQQQRSNPYEMYGTLSNGASMDNAALLAASNQLYNFAGMNGMSSSAAAGSVGGGVSAAKLTSLNNQLKALTMTGGLAAAAVAAAGFNPFQRNGHVQVLPEEFQDDSAYSGGGDNDYGGRQSTV
ncbi:MAG: hypothetical protein WDW38_010339 [Sanguina aurantia]